MAALCCDCFWPRRNSSKKSSGPVLPQGRLCKPLSQEHLLGINGDRLEKSSWKGVKPSSRSAPTFMSCDGKRNQESDLQSVQLRMVDGSERDRQPESDRRSPVKETFQAVCYEDADGKKMINEYVRDCKIGSGSYGKVVLHRSQRDNNLYAIKIFHKSRLRKLRVAPAETAMMDVLREVAIMKKLDHPNIVKLVEVIDDPECDHFYMVLEYVAGRWIFEGSGPPGGIGVGTAKRYFRDVVSGLIYLHDKNIVHGDIKPENLLITSDGHIKIGDFGVSRSFEGKNDELRRSPGTPVYTAPECCLGVTYRGKAADVWALGCTLYCMVIGKYPFVGDTLQATYEKIVQEPFAHPEDMDPDLLDLLQGLLCKDPVQRLTLDDVAIHSWVVKGYGPLQRSSSRF